MLHNKFVVVVRNDKASGNVVFVCQRHYAQFLTDELGLNNVNNITSTYTKVNKPLDETVADNTSFLKRKFSFEVTEINENSLIYGGLLNRIRIQPKKGLQLPHPSVP